MPRLPRIRLWSHTIQLFHTYPAISFEGPFKKAAFDYRIEPVLSTMGGDDQAPDIIGSGPSGWCIIEVTFNDKSKSLKVGRYGKLDGHFLSTYGLTVHPGGPDVMTGRLEYVDDGECCQLLVKEVLEVRKVEKIRNEKLREALAQSIGCQLESLPPIPVSLLPEMEAHEIRLGLVDIVMQIFGMGDRGKSLQEIVEDGLERLADKITSHGRIRLTKAVREQMESLIQGPLKEYLTFDGEKYMPTSKWTQHQRSREFISKKLNEWAVKETRLYDFGIKEKS